MRFLLSCGLVFFGVFRLPAVEAADNPVAAESAAVLQLKQTFAASDSLDCSADEVSDANECLRGLSWKPAGFDVQVEAADPGRGEWLIRFPSPLPSDDAVNDRVAMEFHVARDSSGLVRHVPAVVVVHESGGNMAVGRSIARGICALGMHAFMIQLPGYGARRNESVDHDNVVRMLPALRQAIADVRRARDAVTAIPCVDSRVVGVQGTSLGGFVTATAAGLDQGYDRVFILLAGGNLHDVVLNGAKDAAKLREKLQAAGVTREQILFHSRLIEPMRLAHRMNPQTTWIYSGQYDDVVPPACSIALARAASLPADHHIQLPADHYSGVIFLPMVLQQIQLKMTSDLR